MCLFGLPILSRAGINFDVMNLNLKHVERTSKDMRIILECERLDYLLELLL